MSAKDTVSNNLVALGAAVVLTVYAAGYARTEPAARRLGDEADERRPSPRPPASIPVGEVALPRVDTTPVSRAESPRAAPVVVGKSETGVVAAVKEKPKTNSPPADSGSVPTPVAPGPAAVAASQPVAPAPADTATKVAEKDTVVVYKDGTYFGWGTSRHGDIQMGIEIKGGRIASAFISECYTQYSCSWVSHLQKQVVERQSADVDYVSGATQSANALYRAVVNALKQAK